MKPACPSDNRSRLEALRRYGILDTPNEPDYDDITALAAEICEAPIAVINFIDEKRQWFKSKVGLAVDQTPLDISICAHAILQPDLFVVPDTLQDPRFARNPLVTGEPYLRFYAGALLATPEGQPLGTLCVLDKHPRQLRPTQAKLLRVLARQVMHMLELRRQVEQLRSVTAELDRELEARREILDVVTHDLGSPLSTLGLVASILERVQAEAPSSLRPVLAAQAGHLERAKRTMTSLVADLTDASNVEQGQLAVTLEPCEAVDIVREVHERFSLQAATAEIELTVDCPPALGRRLQADADRLVQALGNLLSNALKFTPAGGRVELGVACESGEMVFRVSDSGPGIPAEQLERIFDRFWASKDERGRNRGGGRGLGLPIVRGIVEAHGGRVTVESEPGRGAHFTLHLPASISAKPLEADA